MNDSVLHSLKQTKEPCRTECCKKSFLSLGKKD